VVESISGDVKEVNGKRTSGPIRRLPDIPVVLGQRLFYGLSHDRHLPAPSQRQEARRIVNPPNSVAASWTGDIGISVEPH